MPLKADRFFSPLILLTKLSLVFPWRDADFCTPALWEVGERLVFHGLGITESCHLLRADYKYDSVSPQGKHINLDFDLHLFWCWYWHNSRPRCLFSAGRLWWAHLHKLKYSLRGRLRGSQQLIPLTHRQKHHIILCVSVPRFQNTGNEDRCAECQVEGGLKRLLRHSFLPDVDAKTLFSITPDINLV